MKFGIEIVTPEQARELLLASEGVPNRRLNKTRVLRFAHAIDKGQWQVTHQGLALDTEGKIVDGQHRLSAIVEANKPVEMVVFRDVDRGTFKVVDTGAARSATDAMVFAGLTNGTAITAMARFMLSYDQIKGTKAPLNVASRLLTTVDVMDYVQSDRGKEALDLLTRASVVSNHLGRFGVRTWLTVGFVAIHESGASRAILHEFIDRVDDGALLPVNSPILWFRHWIINEHGYGRLNPGSRPTSGLANLIIAFNMWAAGQSTPPGGTHAWRMGQQAMPVPNPFPRADELDIEEEEELPTDAEQLDIEGNVTTFSVDRPKRNTRKRA